MLDDSCRANDVSARCFITDDTRAFGIQTDDGKYFKLDADGSFSEGEIKVTQNGTSVQLDFNMNADSNSEMSIVVANAVVADFTAIDFVL